MIIAITPTIMGTIILFIVVIIFKLLANDSLSFIHKKKPRLIAGFCINSLKQV